MKSLKDPFEAQVLWFELDVTKMHDAGGGFGLLECAIKELGVYILNAFAGSF